MAMTAQPATDVRPPPLRRPTQLPRRCLVPTLKRAGQGFLDDHAVQWAAALTFFAILSVFPGMLVLVSVLGLIGASAVEPLITHLGELAPGTARDVALDALRAIREGQDAAGPTFAFGLAAAVWSASAYVGAFIPAANIVWAVDEQRPFWSRLRLRVLLTLTLLLLIAVMGVGVALTGPVAEELGAAIGLEGTVVAVWAFAKWPVLASVLTALLMVIYWAAPNVRHPGWSWVLPGSIVAVLVWILASLGLTLYLSSLASYNGTYGSIGGALAVLLWLWLTNLAILLGAEVNAELERSRGMEAGTASSDGPFLPAAHTEPGGASSSR